MNKILKKLLLLSLIFSVGYKIFSMEKEESNLIIQKPAQICYDLRIFYQQYELKTQDYIFIKIESILALLNSLSIKKYNEAIENISKLKENLNINFHKIPRKVHKKLNVLFTANILNDVIQKIIFLFSNQIDSHQVNLINKTTNLYLNNQIDLFTELFECAKKNNLDTFERKIISQGNFAENFFIIAFKMFPASILENYRICIDNDIFNQINDSYEYGEKAYLTLIIGKLLLWPYVFEKGRDLNKSKALLKELLNEPSINLKTWRNTLVDLPDFEEEIKITDPVSIIALKNNFDKLCQILKWREEKIKALRSKLFEAIEKEDLELTKKLAHSLYVITRNFENENGDTPLHVAIYKKQNHEIIKILLSIYPDLIFFENNQGQTSMHLAALSGPEMLKFMMDIVYDINKKSAI